MIEGFLFGFVGWFIGSIAYVCVFRLEAKMNRDDKIKAGWRQCAEGQRTTQYCALLEEAVKAEREACAKVCEADGLLWGQKYAAAIRARGEK